MEMYTKSESLMMALTHDYGDGKGCFLYNDLARICRGFLTGDPHDDEDLLHGFLTQIGDPDIAEKYNHPIDHQKSVRDDKRLRVWVVSCFKNCL